MEKRCAVEKEDYDLAKEKKQQMERYRGRAYARLQLHGLLDAEPVGAGARLGASRLGAGRPLADVCSPWPWAAEGGAGGTPPPAALTGSFFVKMRCPGELVCWEDKPRAFGCLTGHFVSGARPGVFRRTQAGGLRPCYR